MDIKYLAQDQEFVEEAPQPFVIKIANGISNWKSGTNNSTDVVASVDYEVVSGNASANSTYTLYLAYTNANGTKVEYPLASTLGPQLAIQPKGKLSGTATIVAPQQRANQAAELLLKESRPSPMPQKPLP